MPDEEGEEEEVVEDEEEESFFTAGTACDSRGHSRNAPDSAPGGGTTHDRRVIIHIGKRGERGMENLVEGGKWEGRKGGKEADVGGRAVGGSSRTALPLPQTNWYVLHASLNPLVNPLASSSFSPFPRNQPSLCRSFPPCLPPSLQTSTAFTPSVRCGTTPPSATSP